MSMVATILRAVQLVRAAGVTVTFEPGWETRGNGYSLQPVGIVQHHTAAPSSPANPFPSRWVLRDGRAGLSGPLCNSAGPADGTVHVVAAQAANHAGASGGGSMGPLPVTTLFNPKVWGHEIDYAGTVPMLDVQYRAAVLWSAALLRAMAEAGLIRSADVERVRAHAETSITGKWDPGYALDKTYDMPRLRADVARALTGGLTMTTPQQIWTLPIQVAPGTPGYADTAEIHAHMHLSRAHSYARRADDKLGALGPPVARIEAKVDQLLAMHAGGASFEDAMAEIRTAAESAAREGAREGVTADILDALDALEARLQLDDAEQARDGAREALAGLRDALPSAGPA